MNCIATLSLFSINEFKRLLWVGVSKLWKIFNITYFTFILYIWDSFIQSFIGISTPLLFCPSSLPQNVKWNVWRQNKTLETKKKQIPICTAIWSSITTKYNDLCNSNEMRVWRPRKKLSFVSSIIRSHNEQLQIIAIEIIFINNGVPRFDYRLCTYNNILSWLTDWLNWLIWLTNWDFASGLFE